MMNYNNNINITNLIQQIKNDHIHGSSYITEKTIDIVLAYTKNYTFNKKSHKEILSDYAFLFQRLSNTQPQMASILSFCNHLLFFIESEKSFLTKNKIIQYCLKKKEHINTCNITIATHVIPLISSSETIGTYSFSSAVYTSLFYIKKADIDINVICSESRPNNEGILLAKSLGKQNIKTTLVTDATLFSLSNTIDKLLLGADSVSLHGVINKIGSSPFIQQTQIHDVPRYILCSEDTILPFDYILPKEQSKPQHEIISEKLKHVSIINPYFDITSLEFLTGIITEKGIYSPQQIKSLIKKRKIHPLLTAKQ